ncbi:leucine-rich repeat protein [Mobilitalea sibirica]|uniref:Leucine-rich repeat protein n=2 Tax=Mobilitalea sibirica TaxID=1462919 RepID=A0A8J7KZN9_9FIRM|nr:leucine-rich repeat protein [Mobilitalea sibirica]
MLQTLTPVLPVQASQTTLKPTSTITKKTLYVGYKNHTIQLKNTKKNVKVTYKSSNRNVATVSSDGQIKPVKPGKATITVTINQDRKNYTTQIAITVKNPYVSITNNPKELKNGSTYAFQGKAYGILEPSLTWTSSDQSVGIIGKTSGFFVAKSTGSTVITLEDASTGIKQEIKVNVILSNTYTPPKGFDSGVYLSGLDLSKETGPYYKTSKEEYIDTSRFVLFLDENVEIPVNIIELINHIMDSIEIETGYHFYVEPHKANLYFGLGNELKQYFSSYEQFKNVMRKTPQKVGILVTNHNLAVDAVAIGDFGILLKPEHIKLLDGNAYVIIHELLHVAWFRNGYYMEQVLSEGFTTYFTAKITEKDTVLNCSYDSYDKFKNYKNIITEDGFEDLFIHYTAGQSAYQLGFRMMHFIIETYGLDAYRIFHERVTDTLNENLAKPPMDIITSIMKSEFSMDFFESFARWHAENREKFGDKDMTLYGDWFIDDYGYLRKYYGSDKHVVIPNTVHNIQPEAFMDCKSIETVEIHDGITSIGAGAFYDCKNLKEVTLPDSVQMVGFNTFEGCSNLKKVILPKGLTKLAIRIFMDCTALTDIKLPNGITSIGANAFTNCSSITSITLPESLETIGHNVFRGCSSLKSIEIPDGVKSLPHSLFADCTSLESVTLPQGISIIDTYTFYRCTSLKQIKIPDGVTLIGESAFSFSGITNVHIPDSVTVIGNSAFANCKNLKKITIPKSVTSIGKSSFYGCEGLTIYGKKGSYAERYAKENKIKFIKAK